MKASKPASRTNASSSPFSIPCQRISPTVLTEWSERVCFSGRGTHSSSSTRMGDQHRLRQLENGYGLLAADRRKMIQERIERLSALEVVEKRLHRHPGPYEDGSASEDLGIGMDDGLLTHGPPPGSRILYPWRLRRKERIGPRCGPHRSWCAQHTL